MQTVLTTTFLVDSHTIWLGPFCDPVCLLLHASCCLLLMLLCLATRRFHGCCCEACQSAPRLLRPIKVDGGNYGSWASYADVDSLGPVISTKRARECCPSVCPCVCLCVCLSACQWLAHVGAHVCAGPGFFVDLTTSGALCLACLCVRAWPGHVCCSVCSAERAVLTALSCGMCVTAGVCAVCAGEGRVARRARRREAMKAKRDAWMADKRAMRAAMKAAMKAAAAQEAADAADDWEGAGQADAGRVAVRR